MGKTLFEKDPFNLERPTFEEDIQKFKPNVVSEKRKNLQAWFFVEFYGEPERFDELSKILKLHISGTHRIDAKFFYEIVKNINIEGRLNVPI